MRTRLLKITLLVTALTPLAGFVALAQETAVSPPPAKSDAAPAQAPATENKAIVTKGKDTLSVDFPDEEIRNVLRNVADLFELNLVIPEALQGKTSIKLRDVTWRQIFQVVLQPVGYTFVEDGNIIKVVTQESLNL
jgi:type IV pilus assembly protein PilQ